MNKNRMQKLTELMGKKGLSQILVSAPSSVFYLTGRRVEPGERMVVLLVRENGDCTLFANRLFALSGTVDVPLVEYDDTDDCVKILADALDAGKIGIDKTWPSQFTIRLMEARSDIRPVLGSAPVDEARLCKDPEEIRRMKASSALNDRTLQGVIQKLFSGMSETEGADLYSREAVANGASGNSFAPLVCFGENCADPHHSSVSSRKLSAGDSVILDVGLLLEDYCSDMTRTVFIGKPTDEQKKVYDIVKAANAAGRAAVRPGVPLKDVDRAARKVIEDAGYGPYFIHRTGHGIGLDVHEFPDVSATSEAVCLPGMCFSVEPGIYLPGRFGVRIEDLVTVTENGAETMNALPRELLSLDIG